MSESDISAIEANYWWRQNSPAGALLHKLMVLFIAVPIVLVAKKFYASSFVVFAFMVPYGLFLRHLAVRAVLKYLHSHPEQQEEFEQAGIIGSP